jgi:DNA-directed RNA polymerase specialized sigma24 family protein
VNTEEFPTALERLLAAECAAEAAGTGTEAADLRQAVLLRWLEHRRRAGAPASPAAWLRAAVRAEARPARRRAAREVPWETAAVPAPSRGGVSCGSPHRVLAVDGREDPATPAEAPVLAAERGRALRALVTRLPGRCPEVLTALLGQGGASYREIAGELGMSQGSLGPVRSRCLGCLRRMLPAEVAATARRGRTR